MEKENNYKGKLNYMKKIFFVFTICIFSAFISFDEFIDYYFPNEVNKEMAVYIDSQIKKDSSADFFAIISNIKDTVYLNVMEYNNQSKFKLNELIQNTNRRIIIGERKIPVLSNIDFLYSSIIQKPNANGGIDNITFGGGGFYLHFYSTRDKKGVILRKGVSQ